jgi:hypothetical protein
VKFEEDRAFRKSCESEKGKQQVATSPLDTGQGTTQQSTGSQVSRVTDAQDTVSTGTGAGTGTGSQVGDQLRSGSQITGSRATGSTTTGTSGGGTHSHTRYWDEDEEFSSQYITSGKRKPQVASGHL